MDVTKLKERRDYFFQIQGQVGIAKIYQGIFFVYTHHGYFIQMIMFDDELWKQMLIKFNYFWSKYIAPEILNGNPVSSSLSSNDVKLQPAVSLLNVKGVKNVTNDEDFCGLCFKKLVDPPKSPADFSISCDICDLWCHILCAGVTEDQSNDIHFDWICPFCSKVDFVIS